MIIFSFGLMIVSLFAPNIGHLVAVLITFSGVIYYFPFVYLKLNTDGCVPFGLKVQVIIFEVSDPHGSPASAAAARPFGSEGVIDVDEIRDFSLCRRRNGISNLRSVHGCGCVRS